MLPRIAYTALFCGLLSLAISHNRSGQDTWRLRLIRTTSLLLVLDALLLGPLSPPALISMGAQCWLLLQLRTCLQRAQSNTVSGRTSASPIDAGRCRSPPPFSSPPRMGVKYLASSGPDTSDTSVEVGHGIAVGLYGEVALFTALWLLTGRQYFFITGHTNAFAKIDVTASFVGFHGACLAHAPAHTCAACFVPPSLLTWHFVQLVIIQMYTPSWPN